ncbi:MAG: hypothetical protein IJ173_05540 [Kiritimatiellae bacterium]|nr:hypothetical protein [Kiritimatiellia bacterium]
MDWNAFGVVAACAWCGLLLALGVWKILNAESQSAQRLSGSGGRAPSLKPSLRSLRLCASALKQKPLPALVFLAFAALATVEAQKTGQLRVGMERGEAATATLNSQLSTLNSTRAANHEINPAPLTDVDIDRGYLLVEEDASAAAIEIPTNAVTVGNWHLHGARSSIGNNRLDLTPWSFPLGTNHAAFSSFWYFVEGKLRPTPRDATHEICAVGAPMLALQGASCLWLAVGDDDSRTLVWDSFFLNGDTNAPVTAQIQLWPDGDFATQSNSLRRVYARINPDDWDGDGLANAIDPAPTTCDGDFYGTANALPTNANVDAYYWLDVSATGVLGVATIRVTCDGPSDLGDHVIVARTNEVCHVPLLAGATYDVESDLPIETAAVSSEYAEITTNGARHLTVSLPLELTFERVQLRGGPESYVAHTSPIDVLPRILGLSGGCCSCVTNEQGFSWSCGSDCRCAGSLHVLDGLALWEGYSRVLPSELRCPCATEGDDVNGAGVNIAFADAAVVFENAYTNAPGEVVARRSTTVTLGGRVVGGEFGGTFTVTLTDGGRLVGAGGSLPTNVTVAAGETFTFGVDYEGLAESAGVGDISATATFTENMTGRILADTTTLTSVRVELTPEIGREGALHRHRVGIGEEVEIETFPSVPGWTVLIDGAGSLTNRSGKLIYQCPFVAEENGMTVTLAGGFQYQPLLSVIEPTGVVALDVFAKSYLDAEIGVAGWAGMTLDLYLEPRSVAFGQIQIVEVPEYGTGIDPTGYFATNAYENIWHHTVARGAGVWRSVYIDNMFLPDHAELGERLPVTPWTAGQITWRIPIAWRKLPADEYDYQEPHEFGTPYYQIFTINSGGTLRVTKLQDYWVERDPDGTRRKSQAVGGTL